MKRVFFLLIVIVFFFHKNNFAQFRYGLPNYRIYDPTEFNAHPQSFSIFQLWDGRIAFCNALGLVVYDGKSFENYIPDKVIRVAFTDSAAKKFYFGGDDNFGYMEQDSIGKYKFTFLSDMLPDSLQDFTVTLGIIKKGNTVFVSTIKRIFIFKNDTLFRSFKTGNFIFKLFDLNGKICFYDAGLGICEIKNDTIFKLKGGDFCKGKGLSDICMLNNKDEALVSLSGTKEIYRYNLKTGVSEKINLPIDYYIKDHGIVKIKKLDDGNWVVVTDNGGVVFTDDNFSPVFVVNSVNSGIDEKLSDVYQDNLGNVWIATSNGVVVVYYKNKIFKIVNKQLGIKNIITSICRNDSLFYISTFSSFLKSKINHSLTKEYNYIGISVPEILMKADQFLDMKPLSSKEEKFLLSGDGGIFYYNKNQIENIAHTIMGYNIYSSFFDSTVFYASTYDGVVLLKYIKGEWEKPVFAKLGTSVISVYEYEKGKLYALMRNGFAAKIDFNVEGNPTIKRIKLNNSGEYFFYMLDDTLFTFSRVNVDSIAVLYLDSRSDSLIPWHYKVEISGNSFKEDIIPNLCDKYVLKKHQTYYLPGSNFFTKLKISGDTIYLDNHSFRSLKSKGIFNTFIDTQEHMVWGVSADVLYSFPENYTKQIIPFNCIIKSVKTAGDSILALNNTNPDVVLPYKYNTVFFSFVLPFFEVPDKTEYSYFLEGFDERWSLWEGETFTKYTNLPPGKYVFRVKAKNVYGEESRVASFRFTILPPWYMTWWAYILYLLGGAGLVALIVWLNFKRLLAAKKRLEKMVKERTMEILIQKEEIEAQRDQILEQNKLITKQKENLEEINDKLTNSIEYAKKIQDAVLPDEERLKNLFKDAFVYFRPKDIVSGDFYWFYKIKEGDVIVALSDCTGHGVPGAFMSMIGISLLNELVMDRKLYSPQDILLELHKSILKSLHRNSDGKTFDGMDTAIVRVNENEGVIEISSANQYVFIFGESFQEIYEGDLYSIGDPFANDGIIFSTKKYKLNEGITAIYLSSDGYFDQFGGKEGKKYSVNRFVKLLAGIQGYSFLEQKAILEKEFEGWRGQHPQLDDVLVVGIKLK